MNFLSNLRFHRNSVRMITSPPFIALGYACFSKVCCFCSSFSFLKTLEDKNVEMYLILQIYVYLICHVMHPQKLTKCTAPITTQGQYIVIVIIWILVFFPSWLSAQPSSSSAQITSLSSLKRNIIHCFPAMNASSLNIFVSHFLQNTTTYYPTFDGKLWDTFLKTLIVTTNCLHKHMVQRGKRTQHKAR